ncbi:hypothetical protein ATCC90586_002295 [Pythium insidiosum]|nr:hypothetical protein ATCC90586_002295 [Pythium insidiosum]
MDHGGDLDLLEPPRITRRRSAWSRCEEAVARVAPTATTTCQVCSEAIAQGEWQIGLMFLHVEGFMLMEWYHIGCTACLPNMPVNEVLDMVQADMSTEQRQAFATACEGVLGAAVGGSSSAAMA